MKRGIIAAVAATSLALAACGGGPDDPVTPPADGESSASEVAPTSGSGATTPADSESAPGDGSSTPGSADSTPGQGTTAEGGTGGSPNTGGGADGRAARELVESWLAPVSCPTGIAQASGLDVPDTPGSDDPEILDPSASLLACMYSHEIPDDVGIVGDNPVVMVLVANGYDALYLNVTKDEAVQEGATVEDRPEFGENAFAFYQDEDGFAGCSIVSFEGEEEDSVIFTATVLGPLDLGSSVLCDAAAGVAGIR